MGGLRGGFLLSLVLIGLALPSVGAAPQRSGLPPPNDDRHPVASSAPPAPGPTSLARLLPGSRGPSGPFVSDAQLASFRPLGGFPISEFLHPTPRGTARVPASPGSPPLAGPRSTSTPVGWFVGYANDSSDRRGIYGVTVTETSATSCSPSICVPGTTDLAGRFNLSCEASGGLGDDYTLSLTGPDWWTDNRSYDVCAAGVSTPVGTVYLLRDGSAIGVVKDLANGQPIAGVMVSALSRDGLVAGFPTNVTGTNGTFRIALPPEPSKVSFGGPAGFLSTFNFTNATPGTGSRPGHPPWLNPVDLGTVYLTPETLVVADLKDAVTGGAVTSISAIQACDGATGDCQLPGASASGPDLTAFALPGPDYFRVDALGYTETFTPVRTVPAEPPGTNYSLGTVWLTPMASITLESNLSRPTGGPYPWSPPSSPKDSIYVRACSLNGYEFPYELVGANFTEYNCLLVACIPPGVPTPVLLPPLRVELEVGPDTLNYCVPPPLPPAWPIPPNPVAYSDTLTLNLTAGHRLPGTVWANLTLGDFVEGHVYAAGGTSAPTGCLVVDAFSTDNEFMGAVGSWDAWNSCLDNSSKYWAPCASFGTYTASSFCAPVPPGDSRLRASAPGYASNWTWVSVPQYCCHVSAGGPGYPTLLANATPDHVASINLTPLTGTVTGWAVTAGAAGQPPPASFGATICSAFDPTISCGGGQGSNGNFSVLDAPAGLDAVTLQGPGYSSDGVWVEVPGGGNVSAGTVPLTPDGTVAGTVVDPTGAGIPSAGVQYCPVFQSARCYALGGQDLGVGLTTSDGVFNGTVPAGWLPWATYVVVAFASGYGENWEFVNVSSNNFTTLPPLTLAPVGGGPARPWPGGPFGPLPTSVWVSGRVLDNATHGTPDLSQNGFLGVCPTPFGSCESFPDGINSAGFFNGSIAPGLYNFTVSSEGYRPYSRYLNASSGSPIDLGTIFLVPDGWVSGRIAIDPWESITLSSGGSYGHGYAPSAFVEGCDAAGANCQLQLPVAQNGTFNITVPTGPSATITVVQSFGFLSNSTSTNLSGRYTRLSGSQVPLDLTVFGVAGGRIEDAGSANATGGIALFGLQDALGEAVETGNHSADVSTPTDLAGDWVTFLPPGNGPNHLTLRSTDEPGYDGRSQPFSAAVRPGDVLAANTTFALDHYGWVVGRLRGAGSSGPVGGAAVNLSGRDPGLGTPVDLVGASNLAGFLNVSAPPGTGDHLTVSATLFNSTSFAVAPVRSERTTFLNGSGYGSLGALAVDAFGTIRSRSLLFAAHAPPIGAGPTPSVVDGRNGLGLPGASVTVTSSDPNVTAGAPSMTNWAGEFDADAPIGAADRVTVVAPAYEAVVGVRSVTPGEVAMLGRINLTGDAVVAGTVVNHASGLPVPGASVTLCTPGVVGTGPCQSFQTNGSGVFWGTVAPGQTEVWVNATDYVGNRSSVATCSDCWVGMGPVLLDPDGGVEGSVRGIPTGLLLEGVNITLCPSAIFVGVPCGLTALTDTLGRFYLIAPPGTYDLSAVAPGFNSTTVYLAISNGELVNVGTLFLLAFGSATGTVYDGSTGNPIANASVLACPKWAGGTCAAVATTDAEGRYAFAGAPGPYYVTYGATGFQGAGRTEVLGTGEATTLAPVFLYPEGDNTPVTLSGTVAEAADPAIGIGGATIAAGNDGVVQFATSSGADGRFSLATALGSFTVTASKPGYAPSSVRLDAERPISGLAFLLGPMLFPVLGNVTDGLTGRPIADVAIASSTLGGTGAGPTLATSGPNGSFTLALANGTFPLVARAPGGSGIPYPAVTFSVTVAGRTARVAVILNPPRFPLSVVVLDAPTGLGLAGGSVSVYGLPEPGSPVSGHLTTFADGRSSGAFFAASYLVSVLAAGYAPQQQTVDLTHGAANVTFRLVPVAPRAAGPPGGAPSIEWVAGVGAVVLIAAVAVGAMLRRRRREAGAAGPPVPDPEYELPIDGAIEGEPDEPFRP